jgi:acetyl-CoA acetyltransferase
MVDALVIDACRTPRGIGKAGKGALSGIHPQRLGATVLRALADHTGIDIADVEGIIWSTAPADQLAFASSSSSGEFRYIPDMVSTQHR